MMLPDMLLPTYLQMLGALSAWLKASIGMPSTSIRGGGE